jgi:anti-sigma regulatory factor (Ser/Thr protein kinase)
VVAGGGFLHEALLYEDVTAFVEQAGAFVDAAEEAGEPVLVLTDVDKAAALRDHVGDRSSVHYGDMATIGANPARLIPEWRSFVEEFASVGPDGSRRGVRGIGEPVWRGRSPAELDECALHESLLNLAFAEGPPWTLLCPYNTAQLDEVSLGVAGHHHPVLRCAGTVAPSDEYVGLEGAMALFTRALAEPPPDVEALVFERRSLVGLRHHAHTEATRWGLGRERADDFTLAVDEVATNSVLHGGGRGSLRLWLDGRTIVCDVRDEGRLENPLAGRHRPAISQEGGRGLWMANQLCDLVQVRSPATGTVARLHMRAP